MQVLVNSDRHITSSVSVAERVKAILWPSLDRFADRITRVEVHLSDVNGAKHGDRDKRCVMEARAAGVAPLAVTDQAPTLRQAIEGASDKLERALERTFGRIEDSAKDSADEDTITIEALTEPEQRGKH
jgi:ribosome-associated translation inhibitor RaiA